MSEKTKADLILEQLNSLKTLKTNYESGIVEIQTALKILSTILSTIKPPAPEHEAKSHSEKDLFDCPTCGVKFLEEAKKRLAPEIEKEAKAKFEKETKEKIKSMKTPHRCDDCGEVYDRKEKEDCPTCHGR